MTQTSPASRFPRLAGLLTSLGVLLAVAVGLELGVRTEDKIAFGTPMLSRFRNPEELLIRTADGVHGRPNARYRNWIINSLGFRGPEADSAKAPGRLRVIASGASEMFGLYESPGKEIPRQLEDSLRRLLTNGACGLLEVEVWNAALPGMGLPTATQDLRLRIARFDPDVIVIYPTPAFYLGHTVPVAARPDSTGTPAAPGLGRAFSPRSWSRVREQVKGLVPAPVASWLRARRIERVVRSRGTEWRYRDVPLDRVQAFEASLREVVGAARALGADVVLATHGNAFAAGTRSHPKSEWRIAWERFHPRATADVLIAFDSAARDAVFRVAADSGVAVADVARRIAESPKPGFADYAHFNDGGAAIAAGSMAEAVARTLRGNEEVGCPRPSR